MGEKLSLQVSDGLFELRRLFTDYEHEPRVLSPEDARAFSACVKELGVKAREMENRLSRLMWNEQARAERDAEADRIAEAACRPGSNVLLFPVIPRPFTGGAA